MRNLVREQAWVAARPALALSLIAAALVPLGVLFARRESSTISPAAGWSGGERQNGPEGTVAPLTAPAAAPLPLAASAVGGGGLKAAAFYHSHAAPATAPPIAVAVTALHRALPAPLGVPTGLSVGGDLADRLAKLAELYEQGSLSFDEFFTAKAKVLGL